VTPLALGAWAGLAIALPVTMVTVLVVDLALRRGSLVGIAGAAGVIAGRAVLAGLALGAASIAGPDGLLVDLVAAAMLVAYALRGLVWMILGPRGIPSSAVLPSRPAGAFFRLATIALLQPADVVAFAGVSLALAGLDVPAADRPIAALGLIATVAAWHLGLVGFGIAKRRLGRRIQLAFNLAGYGFAIALALVVGQSG
jgi:hypothetical protein